jgi:hypothetical protein
MHLTDSTQRRRSRRRDVAEVELWDVFPQGLEIASFVKVGCSRIGLQNVPHSDYASTVPQIGCDRGYRSRIESPRDKSANTRGRVESHTHGFKEDLSKRLDVLAIISQSNASIDVRLPIANELGFSIGLDYEAVTREERVNRLVQRRASGVTCGQQVPRDHERTEITRYLGKGK